MINKKKFSGFTLIEMSISILILSILLMGGINFQMATINNSRMNITLDKMKKIESAINVYFLENKRLPCPANPTLASSNSSFGKELRDVNGNCYETSSGYLSNNLIYGSIPNKTIGLPDDYGIDGWRSTIIYIIHKNYGAKTTFASGGGNAINVKNLAGNTVTNKAIYLLISSGENKNGAFRNGVKFPIDTSLNDKNNAHTNGFANDFIKDIINSSFDDIVYYKEKKEIVLSLNIGDIGCSITELASLDSNWSYDSSYYLCPDGICPQSTEILSKFACPTSSTHPTPPNKISKSSNWNYDLNKYVPSRKCLKYGQWSDILYPCIDGCGLSNIASITGCGFSTPGQLALSIDTEHLERVALGEEIAVQCVKNSKVGVLILLCQNDGSWICVSGKCSTNISP